MNDTDKQHDVKTEYFDEHQAGKDQTDNHLDSHDEEIQLPTLKELFDVEVKDSTRIQETLTIGPLNPCPPSIPKEH